MLLSKFGRKAWHSIKRATNLAISTLAAGGLLFVPIAEARDRYAERPPVVLSPDLTEPWQLQMTSRKRARVVVRSSTARAYQTYTPSRWRDQREVRYRTRAFETGSALRYKKDKRVRQKRYISRTRQPQYARRSVQQPRYTQSQRSRRLAPRFLPQVVEYNTKQKPGTIVIDTAKRYLYLVMANGEARRYGVGVGKIGFGWKGTERVSRKAEWPSWRPPASMIAREKAKGRILPAFMPGGVKNPMGARGIYLGSTLYRIHGTNAPWTVGQAVSSGCFRMRNEDVTDLYPRVSVGAKVIVI